MVPLRTARLGDRWTGPVRHGRLEIHLSSLGD